MHRTFLLKSRFLYHLSIWYISCKYVNLLKNKIAESKKNSDETETIKIYCHVKQENNVLHDNARIQFQLFCYSDMKEDRRTYNDAR